MYIQFLRWENSEKLGAWSAQQALQVPRAGDEIMKIMNVPGDDEEGNTYDAVFKVEKVIWLGPDEVDVIIRERCRY